MADAPSLLHVQYGSTRRYISASIETFQENIDTNGTWQPPLFCAAEIVKAKWNTQYFFLLRNILF